MMLDLLALRVVQAINQPFSSRLASRFCGKLVQEVPVEAFLQSLFLPVIDVALRVPRVFFQSLLSGSIMSNQDLEQLAC